MSSNNTSLTTPTDLARLRALLDEADAAANDASAECQAYDSQGVAIPPFVRATARTFSTASWGRLPSGDDCTLGTS